jgi:hypothetical protein
LYWPDDIEIAKLSSKTCSPFSICCIGEHLVHVQVKAPQLQVQNVVALQVWVHETKAPEQEQSPNGFNKFSEYLGKEGFHGWE